MTNDPQTAAWRLELLSSGRVCADVGRVRSVVYAVIGAWMVVISVVGVVLGGSGARVVCAPLLLISVGLLAWSVQVALRVGSWRSPQVVVDAEGVTVRHGYLHVPWRDLLGVFTWTDRSRGIPLNRWIAVGVTAECYDAWLGSRSWLVRSLGRRFRGRQVGMINLPPNLAVDPAAFTAWLSSEIEDRRRAEIERLRRQL